MSAVRGVRGVTLVALMIGGLLATRLLAASGWDPTVFAAFGEDAAALIEYSEKQLGREVLTRPRQGHDGQHYFVQANDPWMLNPEVNAKLLDRPAYRAQRMAYPAIASGLGLFPPDVVVWALPIVNVIMLGVGSWATASIARKHGGSAWIGLAFALSPGLHSEILIGGAGIVAFAFACVGAWALEEDRAFVAASAFAVSALAREVMVAFIAFIVIFMLLRERRTRVRSSVIALPAVVAVVGWAAYIRLRIDFPGDPDQGREVTFAPFSGAVEALTSGRAGLVDYLVIAAGLSLILLIPFRALRSNVHLTRGAAGFAALGPFLSVFVWQKSFDISRALAPLFTVFALEIFLSRRRPARRQRTGVRSSAAIMMSDSHNQAERCRPNRYSSGAPVSTT